MMWADKNCTKPMPPYPILMRKLLVACEARDPKRKPGLAIPVRVDDKDTVTVNFWVAKVPVRGGHG